MKNGWTEAPTSPYELPWNIRAGRRVLWWIELQAFDGYPSKSFAIIGSLNNCFGKYVIEDKENAAGGYYYESVTAYKEIGKGPHDD